MVGRQITDMDLSCSVCSDDVMVAMYFWASHPKVFFPLCEDCAGYQQEMYGDRPGTDSVAWQLGLRWDPSPDTLTKVLPE